MPSTVSVSVNIIDTFLVFISHILWWDSLNQNEKGNANILIHIRDNAFQLLESTHLRYGQLLTGFRVDTLAISNILLKK